METWTTATTRPGSYGIRIELVMKAQQGKMLVCKNYIILKTKIFHGHI